jgi:hypothetical protein
VTHREEGPALSAVIRAPQGEVTLHSAG